MSVNHLMEIVFIILSYLSNKIWEFPHLWCIPNCVLGKGRAMIKKNCLYLSLWAPPTNLYLSKLHSKYGSKIVYYIYERKSLMSIQYSRKIVYQEQETYSTSFSNSLRSYTSQYNLQEFEIRSRKWGKELLLHWVKFKT